MIPDSIATRVGLRGGELAELEVAQGELVVRAVAPTTLASLLEGITPENLHSEWCSGPPTGAELL
jgi:antitoxin component of MazEF toxin-antitoxin module